MFVSGPLMIITAQLVTINSPVGGIPECHPLVGILPSQERMRLRRVVDLVHSSAMDYPRLIVRFQIDSL